MAPPKKVKKVKEDIDSIADKIKENIDAEFVGEEVEGVNPDKLIPTGVTLLNLACSGNAHGGLSMGKINTLPGGSSSGKTFLGFNIMAALANNPKFDDYKIIYDDAEHALEFDINKLFGKKLAGRIIAPKTSKDGEDINSKTIQEFKNNILYHLDKGRPFFWLLDSLDSLASDQEIESEYKEALRAAKSDEHVKALKDSYHTEKAKITGQVLRMISGSIKDTGSSINIIQQTRANMNAGPFGKREITSGGASPFFYSTHCLWTSKVKTHKDAKHGWIIGQRTKVEVAKNKLTGNKRSIEFDLFNDFGIDNIGSMIDFLLQYDFWKKSGQTINAVDLQIEGTRSKLIEFIEENNLEAELVTVTEFAWNQIEESLKSNRKRRFD